MWPEEPTGIKLLLLYLACIWIGDSGAYYVGKNFGRHKMSPRISPNKTLEGPAGGVVTTFVARPPQRRGPSASLDLAPVHVAALAAILAVAAPLGDLVESLFKRDTGVKDSSTLLPGPRRVAGSHGQPDLSRTLGDCLSGGGRPGVMKRIAVLGSTGSIGTSTLAVVEAFPEHFAVVAIAAGSNLDRVRGQLKRHRPAVVSVARAEDAERLATDFPDLQILWGADGLEQIARHADADMVVVAVVGAGRARADAGRHRRRQGRGPGQQGDPGRGRRRSGHGRRPRTRGVDLLPVDSEHSAIHQALRGGSAEGVVTRLILTASGGPFRTWSLEGHPDRDHETTPWSTRPGRWAPRSPSIQRP